MRRHWESRFSFRRFIKAWRDVQAPGEISRLYGCPGPLRAVVIVICFAEWRQYD